MTFEQGFVEELEKIAKDLVFVGKIPEVGKHFFVTFPRVTPEKKPSNAEILAGSTLAYDLGRRYTSKQIAGEVTGLAAGSLLGAVGGGVGGTLLGKRHDKALLGGALGAGGGLLLGGLLGMAVGGSLGSRKTRKVLEKSDLHVGAADSKKDVVDKLKKLREKGKIDFQSYKDQKDGIISGSSLLGKRRHYTEEEYKAVMDPSGFYKRRGIRRRVGLT